MNREFWRRWRITILLIILAALPIAASFYRVFAMAGTDAASVTDPDELRFFAMPAPILLHVIFGVFFLVIGAFQFAAHLRFGEWSIHKRLGYFIVLAGLVFSISGVFMVFAYDPHSKGSLIVDIGRIIFGSAVPVLLILGIVAARLREFDAHRAWMIRAYAFSATAGIQSYLVLLMVVINGGFDAELADMMLVLGWIIGVVWGEYVIRNPWTAKPHPA